MTRRRSDLDDDSTDAAVIAEVDDLEHEAAVAAAEADPAPPCAEAIETAAWFRGVQALPISEREQRLRARQADHARRRAPTAEAVPALVRSALPWEDDTARLTRLSRDELVARIEAVPGLHIEPDVLAQLDHTGLVDRLRGRGRH